MRAKLFIFFIVFLSGPLSFAQTSDEGSFKERRAQACQYLQEIENGVLVVRLTSNAKKIGQLELLKKGKGLSKKRREKYAEKLSELETGTRQENELILQAFTELYSFSTLLFMYDTSAQYLTQGVQKGYFLNDKLEVDLTIDLSGQKYFLVKYGFAEGPGQRRAKGLVVMDSNYKDLLSPFPYKHFMARETKAVGEKEIKEEYLNHIRTLVRNMDVEFGRYLNKCRYKGWLKE